MAGELLGNDRDADGDLLVVSGVGNAVSGTVGLSQDHTQITFTPNANFSGQARFTYTVSDGHGGTDAAEVSVSVAPANDAPVALNSSVSGSEDTPIRGVLPASDIDGDVLLFQGVPGQGPAHGTVTIAGNIFTYQPAPNYNGPDRFTFMASDGHGGSDTADVNLAVIPVNDAPVAEDDRYSLDGNTALTVPLSDLLANDGDVDGDLLNTQGFSVVAPPQHGAVVWNVAEDWLTYTPNAEFTGSDGFTYRLSDGHGGSDTAVVHLTAEQPAASLAQQNDWDWLL